MSGLRIAFICQWYPPEPVMQPVWIVDALRKRGALIEVHTGVPNYPTGIVSDGYRSWRRQVEIIDGVTVRRTPLYPSHDSSSVRRMLTYLSWAVSSAAFGQRHLRRADVALIYSSPATAAVPAMVAKSLFGVPYVLLVQDVWPDSIFSAGFLKGRWSRRLRAVVDIFVSATYRGASTVVVTSAGMVDLLVARGVSATKIKLAHNWVAPVRSAAGPEPMHLRETLGLSSDRFLVMYAGNHGAAQALESAVQGFAEIPPEEECHLVLVGEGVEKRSLIRLAEQRCPDRVHFLPPQPAKEMAALMAQADAQLVSLASGSVFARTTPSKLQSILAAGQPVLVCADGDAARLVRDAEAGVCVPSEDARGLATAVQRLRRLTSSELDAMGAHGQDYYERTMSESVGAASLMQALHDAVRTHHSDRAPTVDEVSEGANR